MRAWLAVIAIGCAQASELPDPDGPAPIPVRTVPVDRRAVRMPVHGAGRLRAADEVTLSFAAGGIVARLAVDTGDRVTRGQVLAVLDATPARARLDGARSALDKAQRDLSRATALEGSGLARQQREDATTGLELAEAGLAAAEFEVRRSVLVAPADGVVLGRFTDPNQTVAPGAPVLRLGTDSAWELEVEVAPADGLAIEPGLDATVALAAYPGEVFPGHVVRRAGGANGLGTFTVTVALDPADRALASGLVGSADLVPLAPAGPTVPLSALAEVDGVDAAVYTVDGAVARRVPVRIAGFDGDAVSLRSPVPVDAVIAVGTAFVRDGAPVQVAPEGGVQ
ncbi:MAG: efflux RND transporter periplasmic adaptor subunit [Myxococcota bacterium]